jgi:hypothetical protein
MPNSKFTLFAGCALLLSSGAAFADEPAAQPAQEDPGVWRLSTGVNYSEGDYGDVEDTKVVSVPVAVKYKRGGFSVRVSVPYVHVDGPGSLLDTPQGNDAGFGDDDDDFDDSSGSGSSGSGSSGSGSGSSGSGSSGSGNSGSGSSNSGSGSSGSGSGGSGSNSGSGSSGSGSTGSGSGSGGTSTGGNVVPVPGASSSRGGLGDVSVTLGYSLPLGEATFFDLSSRVKLPTASTAKRLGTGKVDVTFGGNLVQEFGDLSLSAGARYRLLGKPAGSTLRNTWGAGAGMSYRLPGGTIVGADYDWRESARIGRGSSSEVTGWVNFGLTRKVRMQLFASTGLNERSTNFAGGLSLSVRLN